MNSFRPYRIIHLRLDSELVHIHSRWDEFQKEFCIFWWRGIPLGQFFLEGKERDIASVPFLRAVNVIASTLEIQKITKSKIQLIVSALVDGDQTALNDTLYSVFTDSELLAISSKADITVVICTRNRSNELKECLHTLLTQFTKPAEIIVVDNAPLDDSTWLVCNEFGNVKYLKEDRKGLDIARNTGAKFASSPLIAYLDDDVVVDPHWLYHIQNSFDDQSIDAITGLVLPLQLETESQFIFERYWTFNKGYAKRLYNHEFLQSAPSECPKVWNIGAGANMAFRKEILQRAGYFDERLDAGAAGCSGDSEIWFRILLIGGQILYEPRAIVYHKHRREMQELRSQLFYYMRGNVVASLIQHDLAPHLNYKEHVFKGMGVNYFLQFIKKIRRPTLRQKTIIPEALGVLSGILYYFRNRIKHN
ncbi:glycosyltransferase family 2 protein [Flavihumibacter sediminis]|nr:glycosyltransferase family 2 protein [Flavihumibacter sediminis]